jgi:hypothetical protein
MKYILSAILFITFTNPGFNQKTRFTKDQFTKANTAVNAKVLTDLEKEVIMNINLVRMYPKQFFYLYADSMAAIAEIEKTHPNFVSLKSTLIKDDKREPFEFSDNLYKMAKEMQDDIGPNGIVSHTDSKKRNFSKRAKLFGLESYCAENIDYGRDDALQIVFSWLFDIDVESLGHRTNLLSADYKYAGIKFGTHKKYSYSCVLDLSS